MFQEKFCNTSGNEKKENKELKSRLEEMTTENNRLQQNSATLERYKELYKMDQNTADYPKVAANVIASENSNWFRNLRLIREAMMGSGKI